MNWLLWKAFSVKLYGWAHYSGLIFGSKYMLSLVRLWFEEDSLHKPLTLIHWIDLSITTFMMIQHFKRDSKTNYLTNNWEPWHQILLKGYSFFSQRFITKEKKLHPLTSPTWMQLVPRSIQVRMLLQLPYPGIRLNIWSSKLRFSSNKSSTSNLDCTNKLSKKRN